MKPEESLNDAEEKYRKIFEAIPDLFFLISNDGTYLDYKGNPNLLYAAPEVFLGKNLLDILPKSTATRFLESIQNTLKTKQPTALEYDLLINNQKTYFEARIFYFTNTQAALFIRDISDRKRSQQKLEEAVEELKENEEFLQSVFDSMQDGLSILDKDLNIIRVNHWMQVMYAEESPLVGKKCYEVYQSRKEICPWCPSIKALKSGLKSSSIVPYPSEDNPTRWIELTSFPLKQHEKVIGVIEYKKDITEQKKAEELIKREREKAETYLNLVNVLIVALDKNGNITLLNKSGYDILGWNEGELIGKHWFRTCLPKEHSEEVFEVYKKLMSSELQAIEFYEKPVITKDGKEKLIEWHNTILYNDNGEIMGTISAGQDITKSKKAEENLKKHLEIQRLSAMLTSELLNTSTENLDENINKLLKEIAIFSNSVRSSIFILSEDLELATNTHEWCYKPEDSQIKLLQNIPFETFGYYAKILKRFEIVNIGNPNDLPPEAKGEWEWIKKYGFRPLLFVPMLHRNKLYGTIGFYGEIDEEREWESIFLTFLEYMANNLVNTLERRKAEQKLKESEERYRVLFEESPYSIVLLDLEGNCVDCNPARLEIFGGSKKELIGENYRKFAHYPPEYLPIINEAFKELVENRKPQSLIVKSYDKNGNLIWIHTRGSIIQLGDKTVVQIITQDINDKTITEENLRKERDILDGITKTSPVGIVMANKIGEITFANPQAEKVLGLTKNEITQRSYNEPSWRITGYNGEPYPDEDLPFEIVKRTLKPVFNVRHAIECPNGKRILLSINAAPIFNNKDNFDGMVLTINNVTEQVKSEQKLIESEEKYREAYNRINLYKDLFTHDINNILQNVMSANELNKIYLKDTSNPKIDEIFNLIKDQIQRGARLVSNVHKLSDIEDKEIIIQPINYLNILKNSIVFVKSSFINLEMDIKIDNKADRAYIQANYFLQDVFENILFNSVKYNESNIIEILVEFNEVKENGRDHLKIEFKDNGIGISDVRKEMIFQRADKIKSGVRGMGLGLSLVKRIIDSYGGSIWVEDRIKGDFAKGSNFIILIPIEV